MLVQSYIKLALFPVFVFSVISCSSVGAFDKNYTAALRTSTVHSANFSHRQAVEALSNCLETRAHGGFSNKSEMVLRNVYGENELAWSKYILLEIVGVAYLSYQYIFIGLSEESNRLQTNAWRYRNHPIDESLVGAKLEEVEELFKGLQMDTTISWSPLPESYNQHPGCFFISMKLDENVRQFAVYDPPFEDEDEVASPPIAIIERLYDYLKQYPGSE
jgi:hypothetical protein